MRFPRVFSTILSNNVPQPSFMAFNAIIDFNLDMRFSYIPKQTLSAESARHLSCLMDPWTQTCYHALVVCKEKLLDMYSCKVRLVRSR